MKLLPFIPDRDHDDRDRPGRSHAVHTVSEACRVLIGTCTPGGSYMLAASAAQGEGHVDNLRAMMEAGREYRVYG